MSKRADVVICGAGIAGVATAYALVTRARIEDVVLIDPNPPLSVTTARSGENYRDWWPHPAMVALCRRSTDLMEQLAGETGNTFRMQSTGYLYVSREEPDKLIDQLKTRYAAAGEIRIHTSQTSGYVSNLVHTRGNDLPPTPTLHGADVLANQELIRRHFPHLAAESKTAIHVRRAGSISVQQLGMLMLDRVRAAGGRIVRGRLTDILSDGNGVSGVRVQTQSTDLSITTRKLALASGPFLGRHAAMAGDTLPIHTVLQQKIAMRDSLGAVPRHAPFTIYVDPQSLDWSEEDKAELRSSTATAWMAEQLPGGLHVKPEGIGDSTWIKLGWAMNQEPTPPEMAPSGSVEFPALVVRGGAALVPGLAAYREQMPRDFVHYAGYYTKTPENLPLIGPLSTPGCHVVGALSGFGTMAACAAGELGAAWVTDASRPEWAAAFAPDRYRDPASARQLALQTDTGEL